MDDEEEAAALDEEAAPVITTCGGACTIMHSSSSSSLSSTISILRLPAAFTVGSCWLVFSRAATRELTITSSSSSLLVQRSITSDIVPALRLCPVTACRVGGRPRGKRAADLSVQVSSNFEVMLYSSHFRNV